MAYIPSNGAGNTLNRFGVPINGQGIGILMPKLKYRYSVIVSGFGGNTSSVDFTRQVITAGRPNLQYQRTDLHSYNNIMYIPKKPEWQTLEIVLRDDINSSVNSLVGNQLQKQQNFFDMTSGIAGMNYKFTTYINTLDGSNTDAPLESWIVEGCFIETVNYDSFDYSSSDPVQITLTISFDNATQQINPRADNNSMAGSSGGPALSVATNGLVAGPV